MSPTHRRRVLSIVFVAAILLMVASPVLSVAAIDIPNNLNVGPYIDKVVFKMITEDQTILSLQAGEIDIINSFINPIHFPILDADPDISIASALRNGYSHITINCRDYPFNISAFRRAFAFAFDKTRITSEIMDGFSQEHDSVVPYPNSWCIEDDLPYHYYTAQVATGAALLDAAGFTIDPGTGYRLAPDGTPFNVAIEYSSSNPEIAGGSAQIGVDALRALNVNAETRASDFTELMARLDNHGDYDMVFFAWNFHYNDVDWLAYTFCSEYADTLYQNPSNFKNTSFDSWRNQLLYSTSYEEVYEAAVNMQLILHYNVPMVIVYENTYMQGYRNDVYTGHVQDFGRYIAGTWTLRKIHRLDGTFGGSVTIAAGEPETFNIFLSSTVYASTVCTELWPRLYLNGPDLNPVPYIAEKVITETHEDNPSVYDGNTRFTIDIIQNATWNDDTPITAEDVAFTFTYLLESRAFGNPVPGLSDIISAYAPTPYRAILEFNSESYWQFSNFAFTYILPKHIFNDIDGIGYKGWNTWNPVFDPTEPFMNSGPFTLTDYELGEFYELTVNPDFCYYPQERLETSFSETTPASTTSTPFNSALALAAGSVGAAIVILLGSTILIRGKSN